MWIKGKKKMWVTRMPFNSHDQYASSMSAPRIYRNWVGALPGRWGNLARFRLPPSFNHTPGLLYFRLNSYQGFLSDKGLATTSIVPEDNRSSIWWQWVILCVPYFYSPIISIFFQAWKRLFRSCPLLVFKEDSGKFYYILGASKLGYCPCCIFFTVYIWSHDKNAWRHSSLASL